MKTIMMLLLGLCAIVHAQAERPLAAGTYLINFVANGKTSRVVFTVTDGQKMKLPDFGKLMKFPKRKG